MKKIVLIETNEHTCSLITGMLNKIGYPVNDIAKYKLSAEILQVKAGDISIILTDISLPDSSSRFLEELQRKFPYTPVIILTDIAGVDNALTAIRQGAQDYLVIGEFDHKILSKSIQYAIERKRNESNYRRLFEESPNSMYIFDRDTFHFLAVNNAALHQYGYSYKEFMAMNACDIRPQDDLEAFYKSSKNLPETYFDAGRWRHRRKNGEIFFVHIYAHCTEFEGKKAIMVLAVDIDKKIKTENALQEKISEVENILESITDGFFTLDYNWRFIYINKEFERILNHKRENLIGLNFWKKFPAAKNLLSTKFQRAMQEKITVHFEEYYVPEKKWLSVNAYPAREGLAVYFADITEQKKIQERIFNDEQNLRSIINNTKDIIWSIDSNFNLISANQAYWDRISYITGIPAAELSDTDYAPEVLKTWQKHYRKALKGKSFKIIWTDQYDGETIYEEISFNPIYDKVNKVSGISCFSRDITEHKNYQSKIEKQNKQLREISWIQSHKFRSPLSCILGLVQLFNIENPQDPSNAEIIKLLIQSADTLDKVTREISEHARTPDELME